MPDRLRRLGAWVEGARARFTVWAPEHAHVDLVVERDPREFRPLTPDEHGYWSGEFDDLQAGDRYRYRLDRDAARIFPDPASRFQPEGVHGPSAIVDPARFEWTDQHWRSPRREDYVFYELHVGTFTPRGTFRGVAERLPYLAQLGINAIELMPVADFPGKRNWGYDGVAIFAPARCYGTPDDLRALVNAAHQHGIAVFLDVVYNHLGPDGAYANAFSRYYFTDRHKSPWGQGVNMDGEHSREVRNFFIANALHWIREYHIDGLRLDATHAIQDDGSRHFLEELATTVRQCGGRQALVVAEDHRNLATMLLPVDEGGYGLDGLWADDLHHEIRVHVARDREGYYVDFSGTAEDIATTIRQGWFFTGQRSSHMDAPRGTDPSRIDSRQLVVCIQNHDQVGNRANGERLNHEVDAATFRAISTLLLAVPQTPLLFQGQEWAASSPFLFFTDHHDELGQQVTRGRREEFASFSAFTDPARRDQIPDPQSADTFEHSRLRWDEIEDANHASMLRLYQRLIGLRSSAAPLRESRRDTYDARALDAETLLISRRSGSELISIVVRLAGSGSARLGGVANAHSLFTTEDADVVLDAQPIAIEPRSDHTAIHFSRAGAVILQSSTR